MAFCRITLLIFKAMDISFPCLFPSRSISNFCLNAYTRASSCNSDIIEMMGTCKCGNDYAKDWELGPSYLLNRAGETRGNMETSVLRSGYGVGSGSSR